MGVATLVSGLKNWLYLKKELLEYADDLGGGGGLKWAWSFWS